MIGLAVGRVVHVALPALARIGERLLRGALGDGHALQPDGEPRAVHHGEHAGHAAVFLADQKAGGAARVAIDHGAGGRAVDAELVLDGMGARVVARPERAVGVGQEFRDDEERDALGAGGRIGQPREHEMHDVVGEVVLAVGDEDLLPGDAVAAVGGALGAGAQRADVGARLRLGELHGAHPLAGDEFGEIRALERFAPVRGERIDAGHGEQRAEPERHRGRIPHLDAGGVDGLGELLPAPLRRRGKRVPARLRPGAIGFLPARRHGDGAVLERRAVAVADRIERRDDVGCELARFGEHRLDHVLAEIAEEALAERRAKTRAVLERERHVGNRRGVGHGVIPGQDPSGPPAPLSFVTARLRLLCVYASCLRVKRQSGASASCAKLRLGTGWRAV